MSTSLTELKSRALQEAQPVSMGFGNSQSFELMQRIANMLSRSTLVPKEYQARGDGDKSAISNCMIALNMAHRIGADPMLVMQNLYVIHGKPSWSSKFLVATINSCGRFNSLRYEWRGTEGDDNYGCRAWTIEKSTNERLDGPWVTWKMVKSEGWLQKTGSKWASMPELMFTYRAAAFFQRIYAPEISMGLSTQEELQDAIDITPKEVAVSVEQLRGIADKGNGRTVETEPLGSDVNISTSYHQEINSPEPETEEIIEAEAAAAEPEAAVVDAKDWVDRANKQQQTKKKSVTIVDIE